MILTVESQYMLKILSNPHRPSQINQRKHHTFPPSRFFPKTGDPPLLQVHAHHTSRSHPSPQSTAMQEARDSITKLPSPSPFAAPSPPPYQHHHHYGTFSPPPQQPPVAAAAYHSSPTGRCYFSLATFSPCPSGFCG